MANTPFLNLVKPTDTDQALITDINNNSDKIDTGVSTLSEQCAKFNNLSNPMVTCTTNAEIENAVANQVAAMDNNTSALIYINANVSGLYLAGGRWCGLLQKANNNTLFSCFFTSYAATNGPMLYRNVNGTKTWEALAFKSDISSIQAMLSGIKQTGVSSGIFSLRFTNDQNNHTMALLFSSNPTSDGYKVRLYDVTDSWNIVWQVQ